MRVNRGFPVLKGMLGRAATMAQHLGTNSLRSFKEVKMTSARQHRSHIISAE
jgi:hypothetical protein